MRTFQAQYPVRAMARLLEVSASGFYAWLERRPSKRRQRDEELLPLIVASHKASDGNYGAPRIQQDLVQEHGLNVSKKRVARLMKAAGLTGMSRRRGPKTTQRSVSQRPAPDLVERDFNAEGPDQLWVGDITYVPTAEGYFYLAVVLDVWSRRIIGWSMGESLHTELVLDALAMAVDRRQPVGVIHHSDQGCQYTSIEFGSRCQASGVRPSMGSVGDCYDNAMAESFFATLECELIWKRSFATKHEGTLAVFDFIEGWYNRKRRHSGIDYLSPVDYEERARVA